MKNKLVSLGIALSTLSGVGITSTGLASNANANTYTKYDHHEAAGGYKTYSDCLKNFNGFKAQVARKGGWVNAAGGTCAERKGTKNYHYFEIFYSAPHAVYGTDKRYFDDPELGPIDY